MKVRIVATSFSRSGARRSQSSLALAGLLALTALAAALAPASALATPEDPCPNAAALAQQNAARLPRCWGYELVSPADTHGVDIISAAGSVDGDHAWIVAGAPLGPEQGTGNGAALRATRTASGWQDATTADTSPPGNDLFGLEARSADSRRTIVEACDGTLFGCNGPSAIERVDPDGARTTMFEAPGEFGTPPIHIVGISDDASWAFLQREAGQPPLLPADTHTQGQGLYGSDDGEVVFLGYDQNGDVLPCGAVFADNIIAVPGTGFQQNGISADGGTVVFESPDPTAGCPGPVDLYLRRDGQSVDISAPRPGDPAYGDANPDEGATFAGMSRDGNLVYFTTTTQLAPGDGPGTEDIYLYDRASDTVTRITPGIDVETGAVAVSPGGDYVYFRTEDTVAGQGTLGVRNLFVYHAGQIHFIVEGEIELGGPMATSLSSPITPDGKHLLFTSRTPLTGQPLNGTFQIFQYSAESDQIRCISCPPDGSPATTESQLTSMFPPANVDQRQQSDDGSTVVFMTTASLSAEDVNGLPDTYLWREGKLYLISTGHSESRSGVVSTSADGNTVFFQTTARLVPGVEQDNLKLYAARLGGGFAAAPPPPLPCSGEACREAPAAAPAEEGAASAAFAGPGNAKPRRPRRHHRRHRRHHRRHAHQHAQHRNADNDRRTGR